MSQKTRDTLKCMRVAILPELALLVYDAFPNMRRLRRNIVAHYGEWLLVFKDNSSREVLDAPIEMEDVRGVKEYLGVKPQRTKWYDVTSWVH